MYPRNNLKLGDWKATCDRCGFDYHASKLKKTWDDLYVCKECWEPRQPLDFLKGIPDNQDVAWVRKDSTDFSTATYNSQTLDFKVGVSEPVYTYDQPLASSYAVLMHDDNANIGDTLTVNLINPNGFAIEIFQITPSVKSLIFITVPSSTVVKFDGTEWRIFSFTPY